MSGCSLYLQCVLRVVHYEEHSQGVLMSSTYRASQDVPDEKHCVPNEQYLTPEGGLDKKHVPDEQHLISECVPDEQHLIPECAPDE